ncbi:MAG: glycoside hydrolase family 25 protein [Rhizobiaceae bacterium]|nr:glycoside hydrolase family 25 protein [Rhizobiaceae bacterium]
MSFGSSGKILLFVSCLAIAGCTSAGIEDLVPTSSETTSSIMRPKVAVTEVGSPYTTANSEALVSAVRAPEAADSAPALKAVYEATSSPVSYPVSDGAVLAAAPLVTIPRPMERPAVTQAVLKPDVIHRRRFRDAKPINFGSMTPKNLAVHGVDVSRWQGDIDWVKLRSQGANFAYIKATDGGDHLDPMFRTNWRKSHEAGLRRGAYHFFYWCRRASEQADWFIRNVPKARGALPPVIDVEWNGDSNCKRRPSPEQVREKMQVFMDRLEQHYGQRPIIYTAPDFYDDNLRGAFPNHQFWLRAVAQHPSKVYGKRKWVFWQYSGSGLSQGVSGRIDLNAFHGSEAEWHRWLSKHSL